MSKLNGKVYPIQSLRYDAINEPAVIYTLLEQQSKAGDKGVEVLQDDIDLKRIGYCVITASIKEEEKIIIELNKSNKVNGVKIATLWHIWVTSKRRRQGNAKKLIDGIKQHYDVIRAEGLNKKAISFFRSIGFKEYEYQGRLYYTWVKIENSGI